jgi:hypothetical protein
MYISTYLWYCNLNREIGMVSRTIRIATTQTKQRHAAWRATNHAPPAAGAYWAALLSALISAHNADATSTHYVGLKSLSPLVAVA